MNDSEIVVCSRCGKTHEYGFGGYYYNPHNNFKPECNSHKVIKGEPLVADNDMSISKAVQTLVNESRTVKMTREALIALNFLSDHVSDIEDRKQRDYEVVEFEPDEDECLEIGKPAAIDLKIQLSHTAPHQNMTGGVQSYQAGSEGHVWYDDEKETWCWCISGVSDDGNYYETDDFDGFESEDAARAAMQDYYETDDYEVVEFEPDEDECLEIGDRVRANRDITYKMLYRTVDGDRDIVIAEGSEGIVDHLADPVEEDRILVDWLGDIGEAFFVNPRWIDLID